MSMEKMGIEFDVRDKATADLKAIKRGLKDTEKGLDKTAKSMKKTGKASKGLGIKLGDIKAGTMLALAGITQLTGQVSASVDAYIGAKQAATSYEFTLNSMGASATQLASSNKLIAKTVEDAGIGYDVQQRALSDLVLRIGDTGKAMEVYKLAVDASVASGQDLASVSKKIGQAATGQLEPLMQLGILTKDEVKELNKLEDASARSAAAMAVLNEKVGGATESMDPQIRKVKAMRVEMDSVTESGGHLALSLVNAAGSVVTLGAANDKTGSFLSGLASGLEKSAKGLDVVSDAMANMASGTPEQATLFHMMRVGFGKWESSGDALKETLGDISKEQIKLTIATEDAVEEYGLQSKEADKAGEALRNYLKDQEALRKGVEANKNAFGDYTASLVLNALTLGGASFKAASGVSATEFFNGFTEGVQEEFATWQPAFTAPKKTKKTSKSSTQKDPVSPLSAIIDGAQVGAEKDVAKDVVKEWKNYVANTQLELLYIKEDAARIEAVYLLDLDKIQHDLEDGKINRAEANLARTQSYFDFQRDLDLKQANLQRDLDEEKRRRKDADHAKDLDRIKEQQGAFEDHVSSMRTMGKTIANALSSGSDEAMKGFGGLSGSITDIGSNYALAGMKAKKSGKAQSQAMGAGGAAIAAFAESQGASQMAVNALMAATATAQGFLQISYGNIPGSIAAFTSAAIYGANAAAGGDSKASVSTPQAIGGPSRDDAFEGMYQANLKALETARNEGKDTIVYNFSGATFLDGDVSAQRRVNQATSRSSRMTLGV